jgi:ABC-type Mn2+/Zn2+ transport system ATPase subunit
VAALDAVLQGGGLPRGRLTEIVGGTGSGKTTLARAEPDPAHDSFVLFLTEKATVDCRVAWLVLS